MKKVTNDISNNIYSTPEKLTTNDKMDSRFHENDNTKMDSRFHENDKINNKSNKNKFILTFQKSSKNEQKNRLAKQLNFLNKQPQSSTSRMHSPNALIQILPRKRVLFSIIASAFCLFGMIFSIISNNSAEAATISITNYASGTGCTDNTVVITVTSTTQYKIECSNANTTGQTIATDTIQLTNSGYKVKITRSAAYSSAPTINFGTASSAVSLDGFTVDTTNGTGTLFSFVANVPYTDVANQVTSMTLGADANITFNGAFANSKNSSLIVKQGLTGGKITLYGENFGTDSYQSANLFVNGPSSGGPAITDTQIVVSGGALVARGIKQGNTEQPALGGTGRLSVEGEKSYVFAAGSAALPLDATLDAMDQDTRGACAAGATSADDISFTGNPASAGGSSVEIKRGNVFAPHTCGILKPVADYTVAAAAQKPVYPLYIPRNIANLTNNNFDLTSGSTQAQESSIGNAESGIPLTYVVANYQTAFINQGLDILGLTGTTKTAEAAKLFRSDSLVGTIWLQSKIGQTATDRDIKEKYTQIKVGRSTSTPAYSDISTAPIADVEPYQPGYSVGLRENSLAFPIWINDFVQYGGVSNSIDSQGLQATFSAAVPNLKYSDVRKQTDVATGYLWSTGSAIFSVPGSPSIEKVSNTVYKIPLDTVSNEGKVKIQPRTPNCTNTQVAGTSCLPINRAIAMSPTMLSDGDQSGTIYRHAPVTLIDYDYGALPDKKPARAFPSLGHVNFYANFVKNTTTVPQHYFYMYQTDACTNIGGTTGETSARQPKLKAAAIAQGLPDDGKAMVWSDSYAQDTVIEGIPTDSAYHICMTGWDVGVATPEFGDNIIDILMPAWEGDNGYTLLDTANIGGLTGIQLEYTSLTTYKFINLMIDDSTWPTSGKSYSWVTGANLTFERDKLAFANSTITGTANTFRNILALNGTSDGASGFLNDNYTKTDETGYVNNNTVLKFRLQDQTISRNYDDWWDSFSVYNKARMSVEVRGMNYNYNHKGSNFHSENGTYLKFWGDGTLRLHNSQGDVNHHVYQIGGGIHMNNYIPSAGRVEIGDHVKLISGYPKTNQPDETDPSNRPFIDTCIQNAEYFNGLYVSGDAYLFGQNYADGLS
ncbi:MAG: hypothetical protein LBN03_00805, partial [Bifidobacteriaceae bacterium]|nr:hypothetical protein [Bifidobacteriaceae bacterium]